MDIKNTLIAQAQRLGDKPALIAGETVFSFSHMRDRAFSVANYFVAAGVGKGDKIAVCLPNTPDAVYVFLGIFSLGAAVVPLDCMLTREEIIQCLNHSEAKVFITYGKKDIDAASLRGCCLSLQQIIACGKPIEGTTFFDTVLATGRCGEPITQYDAQALAAIFYTSGSTGAPKGVMLSYAHLDNPVDTIGHYLQVHERDVYLCGGVPFSHLGGLDYILLMVYFGSLLVLMERFHPLEFLRTLEKHQVTVFCIVPAMYTAILMLKEYNIFNLSSLRYAVVFGAPSHPGLLARFKQAYPNAQLYNGWGMTETSAPNAYSPDEEHLQSIGAFDYTLRARLVDEEGSDVSQGELWVKGKAVMQGYYKAPDMTRDAITDDGWFKTGDIARKDNTGLYYIVGRKKDMLKVAGEIVFCAEVEEKILAHPAVKETAVIGVADALRGEVPKAFVSCKDGELLDAAQLKRFLKENLAHFKTPHYFEFIKELPKNRVGKIDKQALK